MRLISVSSVLWHMAYLNQCITTCMFSVGHEPGFCMMCTMQNHVTQVFANSGNVIKPIGVLNDLKRECATCLPTHV